MIPTKKRNGDQWSFNKSSYYSYYPSSHVWLVAGMQCKAILIKKIFTNVWNLFQNISSPWSTVATPCNASCGGGIEVKVRSCTNPRPQVGMMMSMMMSWFLKTFNTGQFILSAYKWWLLGQMKPGHESGKLCGGGQEVLSLQHRALRHAGGLDRHSHHCHHNRQEMIIISSMISWFLLAVVSLVKLQRHLWARDEDEAHKVD